MPSQLPAQLPLPTTPLQLSTLFHLTTCYRRALDLLTTCCRPAVDLLKTAIDPLLAHCGPSDDPLPQPLRTLLQLGWLLLMSSPPLEREEMWWSRVRSLPDGLGSVGSRDRSRRPERASVPGRLAARQGSGVERGAARAHDTNACWHLSGCVL